MGRSPWDLLYGADAHTTRTCHWCTVRMIVGTGEQAHQHNYCTADHVVPVAEHGSNRRANLVRACMLCNQLRGSMTAVEFSIISSDIVQPYRDNIREMVFHALYTPLIAESRRGQFVGALLRFVPENEKPDLFARADLRERFPKNASKKYYGRLRREAAIAMVTRRGSSPYVAAIPRIPSVENPVSDSKLLFEESL